MKGKKLLSDSKEKNNISLQQSTRTPTPEAIFYDSNLNYAKYKEYEKFTALKTKLLF